MRIALYRQMLRACFIGTLLLMIVLLGGVLQKLKTVSVAIRPWIYNKGDLNNQDNANYMNTSRYGTETFKDSAEILRYNSMTIDKLACKAVQTGTNLLKMKRLPFDAKFKSPCWYEDGILQCLPYMYLVGVAKCGTTDMFARLTRHPDFIRTHTQENGWLSYGRFCNNQSFSEYTATFSSLATAVSRRKVNNTHLITGDFSINNLEGSSFWQCFGNNIGKTEPVEGNAEYIYHLNHQARIVILVRNPIDRLWSEYMPFSLDDDKFAEVFHELAKQSIQVYRDCLRVRTIRSCMYDKPLTKLAMMPKHQQVSVEIGCSRGFLERFYLRRGVYHVYIKDFLKVFPQKQILVQRLEDFSDDMERALKRTYRFLGLKMPTSDQMRNIIAFDIQNQIKLRDTEKGDMFPATRSMLYEFYKPYNEELAFLLNSSRYKYGPSGG